VTAPNIIVALPLALTNTNGTRWRRLHRERGDGLGITLQAGESATVTFGSSFSNNP
jgi:hypothetical protein